MLRWPPHTRVRDVGHFHRPSANLIVGVCEELAGAVEICLHGSGLV